MLLQSYEVHARVRGVAKDVVYFAFSLFVHFLRDFKSLQAIFQLLWTPRPDQRGIGVLEPQNPSQGQVHQFAVKFLRNLPQFLEGSVVSGVGVGIVEHLLIGGMSRSHIPEPGLAVVFCRVEVLASEYAAGQGTPGDHPEPIVPKQRLVLNLDVPRQHVVVVLGSDGFMQVELLADSQGSENVL